MESKSVKKVDIFNILNYVIRKWLIVLLAGILLAGIVGGAGYFEYKVQKKNELYYNAHKMEPIYGSFVVYVNNFDNSENFYNRIEDVTAIAKGYSVLSEVIEKNNLSVDYTTMVNCITAVTVGINQLEISMEGSLIGLNQEQVVQVTEDLCEVVMEKYESSFGENSVTLIDKPHAKAYALTQSMTVDENDPENKNKKITKKDVVKKGIIGGIIGVVLGVVGVVFYVLLSTILRTKNEVVECFGMSLLGSVDKAGLDKEEYKRVVKRIKDRQVFCVVSVTDKEYRNETVDCLAGQMAVNGSKAAIIRISADKDAEKNPLWQYFSGKTGIKDMICDTQGESVKLIEWSEASSGDVDLFTNVKFMEAVEELRKLFDYVLIDCPAAKTSAAVLNIAPACDGVIALAGRGVVSEEDVYKFKYNFKENNIECLGLLYVE